MSEVMERREVSILPANMQAAEQWRMDHVVNAPEGMTPEDFLRPTTWAHVAREMQQFDRVEVRDYQGEWILDLIVAELGRNWARMHLVQQHDLTKSEGVKIANEHTVFWRGPQHKWAVKRNSDSQVLQEGFGSKEEAQLWIVNYENNVSR